MVFTIVLVALCIIAPAVQALQPFGRGAADKNAASQKVVYGMISAPMTKYASQLASCEATWLQDVHPQTLVVVGDVNTSVSGRVPYIHKPSPICQDGWVTNPGIACKESVVITTAYELGADWVVMTYPDMYVLPRHWEEMLASHDPNKPLILGRFTCGGGKYCEDHRKGLCGGGAYALSRGAMEKMVGEFNGVRQTQHFIFEVMHTAVAVSGMWSDQTISCIARRNHVTEIELPGLYPNRLGNDKDGRELPATTGDVFNKKLYKQAISSASPKALQFHYIRPDQMLKLDKMAKVHRTHDKVAKVHTMHTTEGRPEHHHAF